MTADGDCEKKFFQPDVSVFKKMVRMLELKRRQFFESDWKNCSRLIPRAQFNHLMLVRFSMPCNLGTIMSITGLTSAGASLFVDKLVNTGVLKREEDPNDRRNIVISVTEEGQQFLKEIDDFLLIQFPLFTHNIQHLAANHTQRTGTFRNQTDGSCHFRRIG